MSSFDSSDDPDYIESDEHHPIVHHLNASEAYLKHCGLERLAKAGEITVASLEELAEFARRKGIFQGGITNDQGTINSVSVDRLCDALKRHYDKHPEDFGLDLTRRLPIGVKMNLITI
jgi:hypothetical protein